MEDKLKHYEIGLSEAPILRELSAQGVEVAGYIQAPRRVGRQPVEFAGKFFIYNMTDLEAGRLSLSQFAKAKSAISHKFSTSGRVSRKIYISYALSLAELKEALFAQSLSK